MTFSSVGSGLRPGLDAWPSCLPSHVALGWLLTSEPSRPRLYGINTNPTSENGREG